MRVEFVGLPGAGKTHACRETHTALRLRDVDARLDCVEDWRPHTRGVARDYLALTGRGRRRVRVSTAAAWLGRRTMHARDSGAARGLSACAYLVAVDAHVRRLEPAAVWLHDQATVQALWSIAMRCRTDAADAGALHTRMAWPDVVVEIRAPLPTIAGRLATRGKLPRSLHLEADDTVEEALERGDTAMAELQALAARRSVTWLAAEDPADVADMLLALPPDAQG